LLVLGPAGPQRRQAGGFGALRGYVEQGRLAIARPAFKEQEPSLLREQAVDRSKLSRSLEECGLR
jgi:hypothetical protein